jgi:hypothetical protein
MQIDPYNHSIKKISSYVDHIEKLNYKEKPVDIITFLKDDYFVGQSTGNLKFIYPGWIDILQEIFYNDNKYLVVLTGSIGIGKSTIAILCMAYILYRILLLRDPHQYFQLTGHDAFAVSFFNLTRSLGDSRGFQKLQNVLMLSPFFTKYGGVIRGKEDKYMDIPLYSWILSSPYSRGFGTVGQDIVLGIMDEVDDPTISAGQKKRVLTAYESTVRRFESRFVKDQECISRFFLVSSKQDELSFLETFVEEMKASERILVIDKNQWEIKPKSLYCGDKFSVLIGDAYMPSRIVEPEERIQMLKDGKNIIDVPVELRFDFERDISGSLRDLAGVSVRGTRRYKLFPSERFIEDCFDKTKKNPFQIETIEIGLKDGIELIGLMDLGAIRSPKNAMHFMHMDISFAHDCLGLAMSSVAGWMEKDVPKEDGTFVTEAVPVIETDFCIRFKAKPEDRIPLYKIRKFILDLKARGIFITKFSADLKLASEDTTQILSQSGIECEYFSVDKTIAPYMEFRNVVFEKRWICHPSKVLYFELKNIEHNRDEDKIDHPEKVKDVEVLDNGTVRTVVLEGSKDMSDAVCGSVYQAMRYAVKPLDIDKAVKALVERRKSQSTITALPSDWFINTGEKDEKGEEQGILIRENDQVQKMVEALKKHKQKKGIL